MSKGEADVNISTVGGVPTLSTVFLDVSEVAHKIVSFLPAKDVLGLHSVDKACHNLISKREDLLFEDFLRSDFAEGNVLAYVANERELNYKRLYLSFLHRCTLPKVEIDGTCGHNGNTKRICIDWQCPTQLESKKEGDDDYEFPDECEGPLRPLSKNEDVASLVFIARVGNDGLSVLMDWEYYGTKCTEMGKKLVLDYHRNYAINDNDCCFLPSRTEVEDILDMATTDEDDNWFKEVEKLLKESCHFTLHVVNVKEFQVMSLLDKTPFGEFGGPDFSGDADMSVQGYGYDLPNLYGVPPKSSPYYRNFTDRDFPSSGYDEPPKGMGIFEISGGIDFTFLHYAKKGDAKDPDDFDDTNRRFCRKNVGIGLTSSTNDGLSFHFEMYNRSAIRICSFLRALVKNKCVTVGGGQLSLADDVTAPLTQPSWVDTDEVLDRITSFASFEDQAGMLRLVCRKFEASALRQLEEKLEKTKVIGYQNSSSEGGPSWFKVSVRNGWSDDCLANEEGVIDDALWFASCRCSWKKCENSESCPSVNKSVLYDDRGTIKTLDIEETRKKLSEKGRILLVMPNDMDWKGDYYDPYCIECSFKREEMSVFEVCSKVDEIINNRLGRELLFEGGECMLNPSLKWDYCVSGDITSSQFVRSIFLVFTKAKGVGEEVSTKKACKPFSEVAVGKAKSHISVEKGAYSRMKKVFRFYSAKHEPIEICVESKSSYEMY